MATTTTLRDWWRRYKRLSPWLAMACYMLTLVAWGIFFLPPAGERLLLAAILLPLGIASDYLLHQLQTGRPNLNSSIITAAIVTVLMPPEIPLWQAMLAVLLAIGSKHFLLLRKRHVFNPAATGVALTALLFGYGLGWWPDSFVWIAVGLGLLNVWRVKKYPQVIGFGVVYLALAAVFATVPIGPTTFSDLGSQTLALTLPWFFMLYMLPEPVTSLQPRGQQLLFGALAAIGAFGFSYVEPLAAAAPLWGLLAANAYAAGSRERSHRAASG